jgi:hypothetical protein
MEQWSSELTWTVPPFTTKNLPLTQRFVLCIIKFYLWTIDSRMVDMQILAGNWLTHFIYLSIYCVRDTILLNIVLNSQIFYATAIKFDPSILYSSLTWFLDKFFSKILFIFQVKHFQMVPGDAELTVVGSRDSLCVHRWGEASYRTLHNSIMQRITASDANQHSVAVGVSSLNQCSCKVGV